MTLTHRAAKLCTAVLVSLVSLVGGVAHAYNVAFNSIAGAQGSAFSSHSEGGFTVDRVSGTWKVDQSLGNPPPSIFGEPGPPAVLNTVRVTNTITGLFNFSAIDLRGNGATNATYTIQGYRSNVSQFSIPGTLNLADLWFTETNSNSAVIDRLEIAIAGGSTTSFNIDNIGVTQVPEPATAALLAMMSLVGFGVRRRRAFI